MIYASVTWVTHVPDLSGDLVGGTWPWCHLGGKGLREEPSLHRDTRQGSLMTPELEVAYLLADMGAGLCPLAK